MGDPQSKRLLIISYYWPPASGPGVQRTLKFCKFLNELGWKVFVVCPANGSYPFTDESLEADVPEDVQVIKTSTIEPFRIYNLLRGKKGKSVPVSVANDAPNRSFLQKVSSWIRANLFIPDARVGWNRFAYSAARKLILKEKISWVITSGPPHSTHLIGRRLKRAFGIFWAADFRDPWTNIYLNHYLPRSAATKRKDSRLETRVLKESDLQVVISKGLKEEFADRGKNIIVVPNGYDEEDIPPISAPSSTPVFSLRYVGNYKGSQDLPALWDVISELTRETPGFKEEFILCFTGGVAQRILTSLENRGISSMIEKEGFVDHNIAVRRMQQSSLLLFPIPRVENNQLIITGKIFEYLASRTPILGIGPRDGNADEILGKCERNRLIDYEDRTSLKSTLLEHFQYWKENHRIPKRETSNQHQQFTRASLTKVLNDHLKLTMEKEHAKKH